jgi:predicted nuclease with TOPRIM domain
MLDEKDIKKLTKVLATKKNVDDRFDKFAVMVQKGFSEMATKSEMNKRFEQVDKRFEQVDKRLGNIEGRVSNIEGGMATKAEMNRRFDGLEDRVLASHQKRIEKLEAEVKELRGMFACS